MNYREVQNLAKETMAYAARFLCPGMPLAELRQRCEEKMRSLGAGSFWYWDVGAFCFSGTDTALSLSGREYQTPPAVLQPDDLITIDLSPQIGDIWGDYARTLVLENGKAVLCAAQIQNPQWRDGLLTEERLHAEMARFVRPDTTFEELFFHINRFIQELGYVNLDFAGNLGHSIAKRKEDRIYTEKGNAAPLSSVPFFTFGPHIGLPGSPYGYKMEDIYYFENGTLKKL